MINTARESREHAYELENLYYPLTFFKSRQSLSYQDIPYQMQFTFQRVMSHLMELGYVSVSTNQNNFILSAALTEAGQKKAQALFRNR